MKELLLVTLVTGLCASVMAPAQARNVHIAVPYQSQRSIQCTPNYLCGYTSANMLTAWLHSEQPTTEYLGAMARDQKGKLCPTSLSDMGNYLAAAKHVGHAPDAEVLHLTFDELKDLMVDSQQPVAVNLDYTLFGKYQLARWNGGHSVVVLGFSESKGEWYINDPLGDTQGSGANRAIPGNIFRDAITSLQHKAGGNGKYFEVLVMK